MFQFNVDRSTEYPAGMKKLQVVDGKVRSVEKNEPAVDGAADEEDAGQANLQCTLTIYPEGFSWGTKKLYRIFDFKNKQQLTVNCEKKQYETSDLHAFVYFYVIESRNRSFLNELLTKTKIQKPADDFDRQSQFPVKIKGSPAVTFEKSSTADSITYTHLGREAVFLKKSSVEIAPENHNSYRHFFCYCTSILPQIRKNILADNHLFDTLRYRFQSLPDGAKNAVAIVRSADAVKPGLSRPSLLAADYVLEPLAELKPIYQSLEKLGAQPVLPSRDSVKQNVDKFASAHDYLDAFLSVIGYTLITGDSESQSLRSLGSELAGDEQCRLFMQGCGQFHNAEEAERGLKALEQIDRSKVEQSEYIDVMKANVLESLDKHHEAVETMTRALVKNPLITGAYKDLGQMYNRGFDTRAAWECFRLARKICPTHPMLAEIRQMEEELEKDYPDFF